MRGATAMRRLSIPLRSRFNPRAPCGARPAFYAREWGLFAFQSTRPMRGATQHGECFRFFSHVSIHAPHAGRDPARYILGGHPQCFNPRAPCGARPILPAVGAAFPMFQSTRPMRGATYAFEVSVGSLRFQSTRPMRGATVLPALLQWIEMFQSTRPMRGATSDCGGVCNRTGVSIHAPHAGRDSATSYSGR